MDNNGYGRVIRADTRVVFPLNNVIVAEGGRSIDVRDKTTVPTEINKIRNSMGRNPIDDLKKIYPFIDHGTYNNTSGNLHYFSPGLFLKNYPDEPVITGTKSEGYGAGSPILVDKDGNFSCVDSSATSGCVIICRIKEKEGNILDKCVVCMRNIYQFHVLIPCGHSTICVKCINEIGDTCPICKVIVRDSIKALR